MDPDIEAQLETMNPESQEQSLILPDLPDDSLNKILEDAHLFAPLANDELYAPDPSNINALISSVSYDHFQHNSEPNENDLFSQWFDTAPEEPIHSTIIEQTSPQDYSHQPELVSSERIGSSSVQSREIQNLNGIQVVIHGQKQILETANASKNRRSHHQPKTTVEPVYYTSQLDGWQPYYTDEMQTNYANQEQLAEYNNDKSEKIQIMSQPRSNFRPRTQNESKNSSHYLRCQEGVEPAYPTIHLPQSWFFHSDVNLIEVALVGVDDQPHPYSITNKQCSDTFEDHASIFRQNELNIMYFVLTKEDFDKGYKTFMIELIKGKQSDLITKELIRERNLEQSKLRFTRIFQLEKGNFQRDDGSVEYSTVMSEAYGDVDVEQISPRYGPLGGQEMVYAIIKGRVLKNDLKIEVVDYSTNWCHQVQDFNKNGNVLYFLMPAVPNPYMLRKIIANIILYHKGEELHQTAYLYEGSIDEGLAQLDLNDRCSTTTSSSMSNSFDIFHFSSATGAGFSSSSSKASTMKRAKRLGKNPKGQADKN